jgi:hypothetical protein
VKESTFDINNLKYEFKVDREKFTVEYGGEVFHSDIQYNAKYVAEMCGFGTGKKSYADFNAKYGITAKLLAKCLNREFMEVLVAPIKKHTSRYCFNSRRCDMKAVERISKLRPVLEQCEKDNIENVAPICLLLNGDPAHCKVILGKSLWKTLCKNSLTKNVLIYKQANPRSLLDYGHNPDDTIKTHIKLLNDFKSKYLKRGLRIISTEVRYFDKYGLWVSKTGGSYNIAQDTSNMADRLNEKFSLKWTPTKMQKMHDQYSLALQRKREEELLREQAEYGKQWEAVAPYLPCQTIELDGYVATLIKTPLELHREGEAMHHCVGGYGSSVKCGDYLVYSITKDGERVSTLGLSVAKGSAPLDQEGRIHDVSNLVAQPAEVTIKLVTVCRTNQHLGKYNSRITEETPLQLADLVVSSLNTLMKQL